MPPPELELEKWRSSLQRLARENIRRIAPTHFGFYTDPDWQLAAAGEMLDQVELWLEQVMPSHPDPEVVRREYAGWIAGLTAQQGINPGLIPAEESVNPDFMSADGLYRYWKKYRDQ